MPVPLVTPDGNGAEAAQTCLAGIDGCYLAAVVEDLQAGLGVEVERPLVPSGGHPVDPQPEQLVIPVCARAVARGGRIALVAPQVAGIEDAYSQHPAIVLDQAPSGAEPRGLGVVWPGAVVVDPELDLPRAVAVAELQEGLAPRANPERAVGTFASASPVDCHISRDCPGLQGIYPFEDERSGRFGPVPSVPGSWRDGSGERLLPSPDQAG